jgi:hypothetical protein
MKTKVCGRCKQSKYLEQFHKNRSDKSGYHNTCKECRRKEDRTKEYKAKALARRNAIRYTRNMNPISLASWCSDASVQIDKDGYFVYEKEYAKVRVCRVVFCTAHNLKLSDIDGLEMHHINGNRQDDSPKNLKALPPEEHDNLHRCHKGVGSVYGK